MEKKTIILLLVAVGLLVAIYKTRKQGLFHKVLLTCFATLLFLSIAEFIYRAYNRAPTIRSTLAGVFNYIIPDSSLGFKLGHPGHLKVLTYIPGGDTLRNTYYTILKDTTGDKGGDLCRKGYQSKTNNTACIFLGCSFTFGDGLADEETLPWQWGKAADISTLNLGCSGYGTNNVYQLFNERYRNKNNSNRIFVYSFLADHIPRALGMYGWSRSGPRFEILNDSLINRGPLSRYVQPSTLSYYCSLFGTFTVIKKPMDNINLRRRLRNLSYKEYDYCFMMLRKMSEAITRSGGRLIILNWDTKNWANLKADYLRQDWIAKGMAQLENGSTRVIPVSSILDLTEPKNLIAKDGHPSAMANRAMAEYLVRVIR